MQTYFKILKVSGQGRVSRMYWAIDVRIYTTKSQLVGEDAYCAGRNLSYHRCVFVMSTTVLVFPNKAICKASYLFWKYWRRRSV